MRIKSMDSIFVVLLFIVVYFSSPFFVVSVDVRLPPSILKNPIDLKIFRSEDEITLECVADGLPKPQYEWLKDGTPLIHAWNIKQMSEEVIEIKPLTAIDEGYYQCTASNQYGKALSRQMHLQRAFCSTYSPNIPVFVSPIIEEGQPYTLQCQPTMCFPPPTYSWAISASQVDSEQRPVQVDQRIQVDENGNLHFSYVTTADAQDGKLYKCNVYNPYLDRSMGGSYSRLNVKAVDQMSRSSPVSMFSSPTSVIALEGKNVTLRCFFSGNPDPYISWLRKDGQLPFGRYVIIKPNTELTIRDVKPSDEGTYVCQAVNKVNVIEHVIKINVQAIPVYTSSEDRPHNMNVSEGDSVTMFCRPYANPMAAVQWFKNGDPLDKSNLPLKFRILDEGRELTISNVCKDCADGSSDLMVIQCNASNTNGYVFTEGYINVLKRTSLEVFPHDVLVVSGETSVMFNCSAVSDDSTPVSTKWHFSRNPNAGDDDEAEYETVRPITDRIILASNGSLLFRMPDNATYWRVHAGRFRCTASNGYSEKRAFALLSVEEDTTTIAVPIVLPASFPWWIILIILLIFVIVLLIILCCYCLCCNKGETYKVDEKERKNGNNPEQELADSGFRDYVRPNEKERMKGSRASLVSKTSKGSSDDENSLNEYGDIDAGKFTEDGSFIGDYGKGPYV